MISIFKAGKRFLAALSFMAFPVGALAASSGLSFTADSLNLNPGNSVPLLALDGQGDGYEMATVKDSSGRAWIRVTKTNPQGAIMAVFQFGGTGADTPSAIKVDAQGEVVIAGSTTSKDFPVTVALVPAVQKSAAFVVKLDSGLASITASTLIGGSKYAASYQGRGTVASGVDVDSAGNVYLGGGTGALDFPVTAGAYQTAAPGYDNFGGASLAFLAEISPSLNKIVFATYFGSSTVPCTGSECIGAWAQSILGDLAVDATGAIIASALVKFAPGGGSVLWSTTIQPGGYDGYQYVSALALDSSGNVIVVGNALYGASATAAAVQSCSSSTPTGGFVAKLSGSSGALQFLTYFGCGNNPTASSVNSVATDASGTIWITGLADPSTLPVTPNAPSGSSYVAALAPDGSSVLALYTAFAAFDPMIGGSVGMFGQALALTPAGNPVVLGGSGFLMLSNTAGGPSLLGGVANSAGSAASGLIAPAELVSFYGTGQGPATPLGAQVVGGVVQSALGGYQLLFGGVAAPLLYIGANQINAIVPHEVSGQDSVRVTLVTPSGTFPLADLYIRPSQPEIFHDPVSGYAAAINQDGTLNSATNPAQAGEIVSIWGTGSGAPGNMAFPPDGTIVPASGSVLSHPALPVSIIAGNDSLEVDYAGDSPGEVFGLLQVNFRLPESFAKGATSLSVSLQIGAAISAPVPIYIAP